MTANEPVPRLSYHLGLGGKPYKDPPKPPPMNTYRAMLTTPGAAIEWAASDGRRGKLSKKRGPRLLAALDSAVAAKKSSQPVPVQEAATQGGNETSGEASKEAGNDAGEIEYNKGGPNPHGFTEEQDKTLMRMKTEKAQWTAIVEAIGKPKDECQARFKQIMPEDFFKKGGNNGGGQGGEQKRDRNQKKNKQEQKKDEQKKDEQKKDEQKKEEEKKEEGGGAEDVWGSGMGIFGGGDAADNDASGGGAADWGSKKDDNIGTGDAGKDWAKDWGNTIGNDANTGVVASWNTGPDGWGDADANAGGKSDDNKGKKDQKNEKNENNGKTKENKNNPQDTSASWDTNNNNTSGDGAWNTTAGGGGDNKSSANDNKTSGNQSNKSGSQGKSGGDGWNSGGNNDASAGFDASNNTDWPAWGGTANNDASAGFDASNNQDWGAKPNTRAGVAASPTKHSHKSSPRKNEKDRSERRSSHRHSDSKNDKHESSRRHDRSHALEYKVAPDSTFSQDDLKLVARILQQDCSEVWHRVSYRFRDKTGRNLHPDVFEKKITGKVEKEGKH